MGGVPAYSSNQQPVAILYHALMPFPILVPISTAQEGGDRSNSGRTSWTFGLSSRRFRIILLRDRLGKAEAEDGRKRDFLRVTGASTPQFFLLQEGPDSTSRR